MTSPEIPHKPQGPGTAAQADPRSAKMLMLATYIVGAMGLFIGYSTVNNDPPTLTWAVLLVVVVGGGLSFVRHSLFHRSDAARIGWVTEGRNNFQIEVGIANLAWAAVALLSVALDWGIRVQAAGVGGSRYGRGFTPAVASTTGPADRRHPRLPHRRCLQRS